jgi:hypothetical protein
LSFESKWFNLIINWYRNPSLYFSFFFSLHNRNINQKY